MNEPFRPDAFQMHIPPVDRQQVMAKPFSWFTYVKLYTRVEMILPQLQASFNRIDVYWRGIFTTEGKGISREELKDLSDDELKRYLEYFIQMECEWVNCCLRRVLLYSPYCQNVSTWTFWSVG
jgi:hypothetical protein